MTARAVSHLTAHLYRGVNKGTADSVPHQGGGKMVGVKSVRGGGGMYLDACILLTQRNPKSGPRLDDINIVFFFYHIWPYNLLNLSVSVSKVVHGSNLYPSPITTHINSHFSINLQYIL